jgi:MarR family transcriptional regulator, lower aerobic nicotinate degradation pathway regulator
MIAPRPGAPTGFLLSWVAAGAGRAYDAGLAELDLDAHSVGVLELLADAPVVQARLSEQLGVFKPQMVPLVNRLQERGLVVRRPHPNDRRAVLVHLLDDGREMLDRATEVGRRVSADVFAPLTAMQRAAFDEALGLLAAHLSAEHAVPSARARPGGPPPASS